MTIELDFGVVCDHAYVGDGGKLFILGAFRYIQTKDVPAIHQNMSLALRFSGYRTEGMTHHLDIKLIDADGSPVTVTGQEGVGHDIVISGDIHFVPTGPADVAKMESKLVVGLQGIPFPHAGDFRFDVFVDEHRVGGVPVHLLLHQEDEKPEQLP